MHFSFPDTGGSSGGGGSSATASNGGGDGKGGGEKDPILTLFEALPWDELDDDSRTKLEKARDASVATSQLAKKAADDLRQATELQRRFQGDADRLKAELEKIQPKHQQQQNTDPYLEAVNEELRNAGYSADDATKLAPVFASMFKRVGGIQRKEMGEALGPMANTVLATQAQDSWQIAVQSDSLGMFQEPTVAQKVWDFVKERVAKGEPTTPDIVANLGKMAWADHIMEKRAKGEDVTLPPVGSLPKTPPMPNMSTGGFTFPGASITPTARTIADPNAAKTALDPDTRAALASSFKSMLSGMDIKAPTELANDLAPKRRGR